MLLVGMILVCRAPVWAGAGDRWTDPRPFSLESSLCAEWNIFVRTFALVSTFALFTNLSSVLGTVVLGNQRLAVTGSDSGSLLH